MQKKDRVFSHVYKKGPVLQKKDQLCKKRTEFFVMYMQKRTSSAKKGPSEFFVMFMQKKAFSKKSTIYAKKVP